MNLIDSDQQRAYTFERLRNTWLHGYFCEQWVTFSWVILQHSTSLDLISSNYWYYMW